MLKYIQIIFTGILTSFYLFPFDFTFLPGISGKLIMAVIGLSLFGIDLARHGHRYFRTDLLIVTLFALGVSLTSVFAVIFNETQQYGDYAIFFISMWVWLSAGYCLLFIINKIHGETSIELVGKYLIAVCVAQCLIAYLNEQVPAVHSIVNTINPDPFTEEIKRWRGIGASLDTAGIRFSAVLVIMAHLIIRERSTQKNLPMLYAISFFIICFLGNIISRTTIVGMLIALCYLVVATFINRDKQNTSLNRFWNYFLWSALIFVPLITWIYTTNPEMREFIRHGFEGFFSLVEKGHWEVSSNEILKDMIVFPEDTKTWIIGEGYLIDPTGIEPYYTGPDWHGWYRDTDIGYLRFLFFSGICGIIAIASYIIAAGRMCIHRYPSHAVLFKILVLLNFICWLKVSTDIFLIFAIFLCLPHAEVDAEDRTAISS